MNVISIGIALVLIALSIVGILVAGIKAIVQGKQDTKKIAMMSVPFVVFGIGFGVMGNAVQAGILTMIVLMGIMVILIAFTGLRGTFKF